PISGHLSPYRDRALRRPPRTYAESAAPTWMNGERAAASRARAAAADPAHPRRGARPPQAPPRGPARARRPDDRDPGRTGGPRRRAAGHRGEARRAHRPGKAAPRLLGPAVRPGRAPAAAAPRRRQVPLRRDLVQHLLRAPLPGGGPALRGGPPHRR